MSKRTFASRTFAPRRFNSATWTGEGTAVVEPAFVTTRLALIGTSMQRLATVGTSQNRLTIEGASR